MKGTTEEKIHFLQFQLNSDNFLIFLEVTSKIIHYQEIFPLPDTADFVCGVINYSGEVIPVLDLKKILKLPDLITPSDRKIIISRINELKVGFLADRVAGNLEISQKQLLFDSNRVKESDFIYAEYVIRDESWPVVDLQKIIETYKAR